MGADQRIGRKPPQQSRDIKASKWTQAYTRYAFQHWHDRVATDKEDGASHGERNSFQDVEGE